MVSTLTPSHDIFSRASARGMTALARLARAFQAAATGSAANGPDVGISAGIAVPIKLEGN